MPRIHKYYPKSEIETGFYANPGEYVFADGTPYVGIYCIASGLKLAGEYPTSKSLFIYPTNTYHLNTENITYFNITKKAYNKHTAPEFYITRPTDSDYIYGRYTRYAAQKINQPEYIIEISKLQYDTANSRNKSGINTQLYQIVDIPWVLIGNTAATYNKKTLQLKEQVMPGITLYFSDFLEFVR
jgi:hypothetical protein